MMKEETKDKLVILFRDIIIQKNLDTEYMADALLALIQILVEDDEQNYDVLSAIKEIKSKRN